MRKAFRLLVALCAMTLWMGCGESGPTGETVCSANATVECTCLDGAGGYQACNAEGTGFATPCQCEGAPDPADATEPGDTTTTDASDVGPELDVPTPGCADGDTQDQACGRNGQGTQSSTCADGQWSEWSECVDPDVCTNDDTQVTPCGESSLGELTQTCVDGQWTEGSCTYPPNVIGPAGGAIVFDGGTLTIPPGALGGMTEITVTVDTSAPPEGYTAFTPQFDFAPDGLSFALPATLILDCADSYQDAVVFWSKPSGPAYEWLGGTHDGDTLSVDIHHFSGGFGGDGVDYEDPVDLSCLEVDLLEGRTTDPSAVALFVTVEDCAGSPVTELEAEDFVVKENGENLSSEAAVIVLPNDGLELFISLVLDMSASTTESLPMVISAAKSFVASLMVDKGLPVRVAIELFDGEQFSEVWQPFWLDAETVLAQLDALVDYVSVDPLSTNLYGALVDAIARNEAAQQDLRDRNYGGAFTTGYVVLFTDGDDTAAWLSQQDVLDAVAESAVEVVGIGLDSPDYDPGALEALTTYGVFPAWEAFALGTAFGALANLISGQIKRTYLVGYCSPKKNGVHTVTVEMAEGETTALASYDFDATGFGTGCNLDVFEQACEDKECGGLACGVCDDQTESCQAESLACIDYCTVQCVDEGPIVNAMDYGQTCTEQCDTDGLELGEDNCPFVTNPWQGDHDEDGIGDLCDEDADNDGVANDDDACPTGEMGWGSSETTDNDGDGCQDSSEDDDDDNDGILDEVDKCPLTPSEGYNWDIDDDGDGDACDNDIDGDGQLNSEDDDIDGDGVPNAVDNCAAGETGPYKDTDGDGCADCVPNPFADDFTVIPSLWTFEGGGDGCQWQTSTTGLYTSAPASLYYGNLVNGNFDCGYTGGTATSPPIDLDSAGYPHTFTANIYMDTEGGGQYDVLTLTAVLEGGETHLLWQKGAILTSAWVPIEVSLNDLFVDPFVDQVIQLKWTFDTMDDVNNTGAGVFIDDISVIAAGCYDPLDGD